MSGIEANFNDPMPVSEVMIRLVVGNRIHWVNSRRTELLVSG